MNLRFVWVLVACLFTTACRPGPGPATATPTTPFIETTVPTRQVELTVTSAITGAATVTRRPPTASAARAFEISAPFAGTVADHPPLQTKLGQPTGPGIRVDGTQALFEHGAMLWRKDTRQIFVFIEGGKWQSFPDTWESTMPLLDPVLTPPAGLFQPVRGFGRVWMHNTEIKEKVGWAREQEQAISTTWQPFQNGLLVWRGGNSIRALFSDNTWGDIPLSTRTVPGPSPMPAPIQAQSTATSTQTIPFPVQTATGPSSSNRPAPTATEIPTLAPPGPSAPSPGYPQPAESPPAVAPTTSGYP